MAVVRSLAEQPSARAAVRRGRRARSATGPNTKERLLRSLTRRFSRAPDRAVRSAASTRPICLTWELTYACNLACVHCLSSSGRRDPRELTTAECKAVIDELQRMQVFYVNVGGGEPTIRPDFFELVDYAIARDVGVKFSTNGGASARPRRAGSRLRTTSTCR